MLSPEELKRLNQLAAKSRQGELTAEEKREQQQLRERYLSAFRQHFRQHLENIRVLEEDGQLRPLKKVGSQQKKWVH